MSGAKDFFQNVGSVLTFGIIPPAKPDVEEMSEEDVNNIFTEASLIVEESFDIEKIGDEVSLLMENNFINPQNVSPPPPLPTYLNPSNNPVNPYN